MTKWRITTPEPGSVMLGSVMLGLVMLGLSCFSQDAVQGLPCSTEEGCGADAYACVAGFCRAKGVTAQQTCGDGEPSRGEYCFPESGQDALFMGDGADVRGFTLTDFDSDGDLDVVLSTEEGLVLGINSLSEGGDVALSDALETGAGREQLLDLLGIDVVGAAVPEFVVFEVGVVTSAAMDDDERPDLIFTVRGLDLPPVLANMAAGVGEVLWVGHNVDGTGRLSLTPLLSSAPLGGATIQSGGMVAADFDGDGDDDLLVVYASDTGEETVGAAFIATAPGVFDDPFVVDTGGGNLPPLVGDLDADGDLEVVIISSPKSYAAIVDAGLFEADLPPRRVDLDNGARAAALGDLDGDGVLDLVVGYQDAERVDWFVGVGDGTFGEASTISSVQAEGIAIADLDGDGQPDLIVADGDAIYVHAGFPGREIGAPVKILEVDANFVLATDLDDDGAPDLISAVPGHVDTAIADP